jgi:hypothetical protein
MTQEQWLVKLYYTGGHTFERVVTSREEALRVAQSAVELKPATRVRIEKLTAPVVLLSRKY